MYDNIKSRNKFICNVKFCVQLCWRKRGWNCELIYTIMRKGCTVLSERTLRYYYSDSDKQKMTTGRE